jgi:hypothetical protein
MSITTMNYHLLAEKAIKIRRRIIYFMLSSLTHFLYLFIPCVFLSPSVLSPMKEWTKLHF